jgi:hypothetical protein
MTERPSLDPCAGSDKLNNLACFSGVGHKWQRTMKDVRGDPVSLINYSLRKSSRKGLGCWHSFLGPEGDVSGPFVALGFWPAVHAEAGQPGSAL